MAADSSAGGGMGAANRRWCRGAALASILREEAELSNVHNFLLLNYLREYDCILSVVYLKYNDMKLHIVL